VIGSAHITWYYEIATLWKPADKSILPISTLDLAGPPNIIFDHQLTKSGTQPTPTDEECLVQYSGSIPDDLSGELVKMKLHAHSAIYHSSMFLLGTYGDFGLDDPMFVPQNSYAPLRIISELGFQSIEHLAKFVLANMKISQEKFDKDCIKRRSTSGFCSRPRPDLICTGTVNSEEAEFNGRTYSFDRRPSTWCKEWSIKGGQQFVALGFSKKVTKPPTPVYGDVIPPFIGGHTGFLVYLKVPGRFYDSYHNLLIYTYKGVFVNSQESLSVLMLVSKALLTIPFGGPVLYASTFNVVHNLLATVIAVILFGMVYFTWAFTKYLFLKNIGPEIKYKQVKLDEDELL
jgi:hypothetical protein